MDFKILRDFVTARQIVIHCLIKGKLGAKFVPM